MTNSMCVKCETFLLDLWETIEFDLSTGCWLETSRTPLFSISRAYMTYICGRDIAGEDKDLTKIAVCPWAYDKCCNPEHLRPSYYDFVNNVPEQAQSYNHLVDLAMWTRRPTPESVLGNFS